MHQAAEVRLQALVDDLVRLAQWLGREEPRRHELRTAVEQLHDDLCDRVRFSRALLRCAVTVDRMYSSSLKRLIKAKLLEVHRLMSGASEPAVSSAT